MTKKELLKILEAYPDDTPIFVLEYEYDIYIKASVVKYQKLYPRKADSKWFLSEKASQYDPALDPPPVDAITIAFREEC